MKNKHDLRTQRDHLQKQGGEIDEQITDFYPTVLAQLTRNGKTTRTFKWFGHILAFWGHPCEPTHDQSVSSPTVLLSCPLLNRREPKMTLIKLLMMTGFNHKRHCVSMDKNNTVDWEENG